MRFIVAATSSILITISCQASLQGAENESFFSKSQQFDKTGVEIYASNLELKRHKKFGLGVSLGGAAGSLGLNSELNLDPESAFVVGLGTGPSYSSFNLMYKRNFEGNYLSPFGKLGYSKWFGSSGNTLLANESDIFRRIFSEKEMRSEKLQADFLVSSVGVEYNQLEGEFSGMNFFAEIVLLTELKKTTVIPAGAVGFIRFY